MTEQNKPGVATGVFTSPVKNGGVSSGYGLRTQPAGKHKGQRKFHPGLDIAAPSGADQVAPDGGIVRYAGSAGTAGNVVVIDHGNGVVSRLFHMEKVTVTEGAKVAKGQSIGTVGSTGSSTGPHVHWEVLRGTTKGFGNEIRNNHINPKPFLTNGNYGEYTTQRSKEISSTLINQNEDKTLVALSDTSENQASLTSLNKKLYSLAEEVSEGSNKKLIENLQKWGENGVTAYAENHPSLKDLSASEKAQEVAKAFASEQIALG